ncbi:MAG: alpha/beta hydrolase [Sphingomonadales bacterium]|nr:alpha/beta hydrolase [Sphingomonadales bacterium]
MPLPATLTPVALSTGVTLQVHDVGPRDAPALIFLHGFPESWRTWRHQFAALSDRFRCIAPDQRGYGASSRPSAVEDYAAPLLAADVFALADALGIERFTVIGHDWGGLIAWLVATLGQFNHRVTGAVIANAPHPVLFQQRLYTDPAQRAASQYIRLFRDTAHDAQTHAHGLAPLLQQAFPGGNAFSGMEPAELGYLFQRWQDGEAALAMLNWYRASPVVVPAPGEACPPPAEAPTSLPPLTLPTLVLWGEDDTALPPGNLEGMATVAPAATIRRLPGIGHFSPWQAPEAVTAAILTFLETSTD